LTRDDEIREGAARGEIAPHSAAFHAGYKRLTPA
jgi:hypothetical protein